MKNKHSNAGLMAGRTLIALAIGAAFPLLALAQQAEPAQESAPAAKPGQLQEVIVTANRRAEKIKDVPMAISTLKGEKLDVIVAGGQDIRFMSGRTPSLMVESDYGRSFPRFYIRGQGNTDFDMNASQPVGLVFDDVVQENPMLKGFPVFDVDQIEVLRGPQGTLFGRNSPAGVIKFDSAKPVFKNEGYANFGFGNDGVVNVEGAYNLPLSDTVAARLSLQSQHRDDRVRNNRPNAYTKSFEGYDDDAARLQLLVQPSKDFSALFNIHSRDMKGSATLFRANIFKPGTNELIDNFDYDSYDTDGGNEQNLRTKGASIRLRWNLGGVTLHSITGYESAYIYSRGDVDGGYGAVYAPPSGPGFIPFVVETADLLPEHAQRTQEFRFESNSKGPLQWIGGLFYFDERMQIDSISFNSLAPGNPQNPFYSTQNQDARSVAVFGSLNYAVSNKLKLRGGLRYTRDKKDFVAQRVEATTSVSALQSDTSNVSGDFAATYELSRNTNLFARAASGYRAPSMQGRLFGLTDEASMAGAEKVLSFEAGVKQELFDKRARLSASVFRYTVKDKQLTAGSGAINMNELINADKVTGHGVELDFTANLSESFNMSLGGSYNQTEIKDANLFVLTCGNQPNTGGLAGCTPTGTPGTIAGTQMLNGNPLPRAPKWQGNFALRYTLPVGNGSFFAYTDWTYRSTYNMFLYEAKEYTAKSLLEGGLRIGYKWGDGKYEVAAFARNITNEVQLVGAIDFNNLTGIVNEPRTLGLQMKTSF
jgi:iron complex outermembrane receptor protein